MLVVCSPNFMFLSVVHCTFTGVLALAIVTVFWNSFITTPGEKKKQKMSEKCICNLYM